MFFHFTEAWEIFYNYDQSTFEVPILKKAQQKMQARIKAMKAAAVPKRTTPKKVNTALTKAKYAFKSKIEAVAKHGRVMKKDWIPLPPDSHCLDWNEMTEECMGQWDDWNWFCDDNWTPMCSSVIYEWYSQDIEWVTPTRPDEECAVAPTDARMTEDCWNQWDYLYNQCYYLTDPVEPVIWTDDCDMVTAFTDAWFIWYNPTDPTLEEMFKKATQKMQPRIRVAKRQAVRRARGFIPKKETKPAKTMQADWNPTTLESDLRPADECMSWYTMNESS